MNPSELWSIEMGSCCCIPHRCDFGVPTHPDSVHSSSIAGWTIDGLRLVHDGEDLKDDRILADVGVHGGSIIDMVVEQKGC
jgi:hypothetical protein